mmetsp:Transcript_43230/g.119535  ORF Transcript_43230/g.119535 Transcript_43230/m.119535 type:complete len:186 (-) Transcript_43230:92-649(-)
MARRHVAVVAQCAALVLADTEGVPPPSDEEHWFSRPLVRFADYPITCVEILLALFLVSYIVRAYSFFFKDCEGTFFIFTGFFRRKCAARHILVRTEEEAVRLRTRLEAGEDFAKIAKECSACASKAAHGSLGFFKPGTHPPHFEKVCFDASNKVGELLGPVQTHLGYHLIIVDAREGVRDDKKRR